MEASHYSVYSKVYWKSQYTGKEGPPEPQIKEEQCGFRPGHPDNDTLAFHSRKEPGGGLGPIQST